jgi:Uma2 family endonuclease
MTATLSNQVRVHEEFDKWVWPRPITFEEFLDLFMEKKDNVELVDGVVVERKMVQFDHEKLLMWLLHLSGLYAEERNLGMVMGSRTAVQITDFRGRLPDLLFVRRDRMGIIQQKALYEAPDLVIEIASPGDRPSDVIALETDYRFIGVAEIVFMDLRKRRVRILRKREDGYEIEERKEGTLRLESLPGFHVEIEWLFSDERPPVRPTLDALLNEGIE